ncbi:DUF6520 family protein [Allomuricauda taeanensis]|uniref:DUF6520 family protein n=1 Tax=Flagellimonas taeanensis TaxID=1005926 RepID=UPI002E7BADC2|nr:DUF6520 family protein [Allomuricauda taeanensis]MEE1962050.1 DUF6520 family protein [Allomuricauda taeanensis]
MKSNFLKLVLPAFAILLAVGLAFATEDSNVDRTAYYFQPGQGWQSTTVEDACDASGDIPCTYGELELQLYSDDDFGSTPLHKD